MRSDEDCSAVPQRLWQQDLRGSGAHHGAGALAAAAGSPAAAVLLVGLCWRPGQGLGMPLRVLAIGQVMALASGYAGRAAQWLLLPGTRLQVDS